MEASRCCMIAHSVFGVKLREHIACGIRHPPTFLRPTTQGRHAGAVVVMGLQSMRMHIPCSYVDRLVAAWGVDRCYAAMYTMAIIGFPAYQSTSHPALCRHSFMKW